MSRILATVFDLAMGAFVRPHVRRAKMQIAVTAIESAEAGRKAALMGCGVILCVALVAGGAIMIPFALCLFMPWEPTTRLWVALAFATLYIAIPLVVVALTLSEKRWLRLLHVDDLVRNLTASR